VFPLFLLFQVECGLEYTPANLQGRSLVPLLANPNAPWDAPAISQMRRAQQGRSVMGYSMRTEWYRYTDWEFGTDGAELYDYEKDPREVHNIADDAASRALGEQLRAQLYGIIRKRGANVPM